MSNSLNGIEDNAAETHTLILMRHGDYIKYTDDNLLSSDGEAQVKQAAARAIKSGYVPEIIVYSPILRAAQTAQLMKQAYQQMFQKDIPLVEENSLRVNNRLLNQGKESFLFKALGKIQRPFLLSLINLI